MKLGRLQMPQTKHSVCARCGDRATHIAMLPYRIGNAVPVELYSPVCVDHIPTRAHHLDPFVSPRVRKWNQPLDPEAASMLDELNTEQIRKATALPLPG